MEYLQILVVDDEFGIRSGIKRVLTNFVVSYPFMDEDIGFDVLEAESGEEAIKILQDQRVDLILLDNKLPGISGLEVLEEVKKNFKNVMVMMITSFASLDVAVKATKNGAYDFVPKPFTPQELKASVETMVKNMFLKKMSSEE